MVYYRRGRHIKISQRKRGIGQSPGGFQMCGFHYPVPQSQNAFLSRHPHVTVCTEYCPPGKLAEASVSRVFIGVSFCRPDWLIAHMVKFSLPVDTVTQAPPQITWLVFLERPVPSYTPVWVSCALHKGSPIRYATG